MSRLQIERGVPLAPLTSLELGGPARYFVRVETEDALREAFAWAAEQGVEAAVLGGGSNLIVLDEGYDGLVVHMGLDEARYGERGEARIGAGVPWESVVQNAIERDWAGIECLTGIPGSTGATPVQNVGAYGQEVAEVVEAVRVLHVDSLRFEELDPTACRFSYRDSVFKQQPGRWVVSAVTLKLRPAGRPSVRYAELQRSVSSDASLAEVRDAVFSLRRSKSMVLDATDPNRRSAGSFFLNPVISAAEAERVIETALSEQLVRSRDEVPQYPAPEGQVKLAAGWLIEKSGCHKGMRRGAVGISSRHALALVHHGGGTTAELLAFADDVGSRVLERFGVSLSREPRILGADAV
jgi:UDP-N-acetylmuramate dehydrogenase